MSMSLFHMKSLISEVVNTELPGDQDQVMDVTLTSEGVLSIRMLSKDTNELRSRISLRLKGSKAIEAFTDEEAKFYQLRVDGTQVPIVLKKEHIEQFMGVVDELLAKSS